MTAFFLHGFGSSGSDFRCIWESAHAIESDSIFLDGDQAEPLTGKRRWFPMSGLDDTLAGHVDEAASRLMPKLADALGKAGSPEMRIFGHSQGGMIALELVRRGELPIVFAGVFAAYLPSARITRPWHGRPEGVVLHGSDSDEYVTISKIRGTGEAMAKSGITHSLRLLRGVKHKFTAAWLDGSREAAA